MTGTKHPMWLIGAPALAIAAPASADAQGGTITYTRVITVEVDAPEEMTEVRDRFAEAREKSFLLHFNPSSSLMVPAPEAEREETRPAVFPMTRNNLDALADMFEHEAASPENVLTHAYSGSGGAVAVRVFEAFRTVFRMDRAPLDADWRITDDQRMQRRRGRRLVCSRHSRVRRPGPLRRPARNDPRALLEWRKHHEALLPQIA